MFHIAENYISGRSIKEDVIETNVCRLQIHAEHTNYFQKILEFQIHVIWKLANASVHDIFSHIMYVM